MEGRREGGMEGDNKKQGIREKMREGWTGGGVESRFGGETERGSA